LDAVLVQIKITVKYFENCERYYDDVNGSRIANYPWTNMTFDLNSTHTQRP